MDRRHFLAAAGASAASAAVPTIGMAAPEVVEATIRSREVAGPLPHIWEECVGSDRAAIKESERDDGCKDTARRVPP